MHWNLKRRLKRNRRGSWRKWRPGWECCRGCARDGCACRGESRVGSRPGRNRAERGEVWRRWRGGEGRAQCLGPTRGRSAVIVNSLFASRYAIDALDELHFALPLLPRPPTTTGEVHLHYRHDTESKEGTTPNPCDTTVGRRPPGRGRDNF